MDSLRPYVVFFALVAGICAAAFFLGRPPAPRSTALSVVPDDAWLVLTVDVEALRSSGLPSAVKTSGAPSSLGALAGQCGFDPLERLRDLVVASPEGGEKGDFGVVFEADVSQEDLSACATKVIAARGGKPAIRSRGGFQVIEDESDEGHARVAYRAGGPFLVGRGAWLDRMVDRAAQPSPVPSGANAAGHAALRVALKARAGNPAVLATAVLPKDLRERLKSELGTELTGEGDRAYTSVLSVEGAGFALSTGPPGSTTSLDAELRCETASACDEVKAVIERKRAAFASNIGVRLVGLGPVLDSLHVEAHGASLSLTASAPTDELGHALVRLLRPGS